MFWTLGLCSVLGLFAAVDSSEGDGTYFLSDDVGPWTRTGPNCTLATPALSTDANGNMVIEDISRILPLLENENDEIWVGYFRGYQNFNYIGCAKLSNIPERNFSYLTRNKPGECYSFCHQTPYIGIIKKNLIDGHNCFCIASENISTLENQCTKECDNDILCGGEKDSEIYLSIYEIDPETGGLMWNDCDIEYETGCLTSDETLEILDPKKWKNAMKTCLENNAYPMSISVNISNDRKLWTSLVRRKSVFHFSEILKMTFSGAYIRRTKNGINFDFEEINKNFKSLCVRVEKPPSTSNTASSTLQTEPTTYSQSDVTTGTTVSSANLSGKRMGPGEYVGVTVGILLGLGILAAVVVILWRKRLKKTHMGETQNSNQVTNAGYEFPSNEIYESNYDEIYKDDRNADPKTDEYDTTNAVRKNANIETTDNVYNKLAPTEETYNHVGSPVVRESAPTYGYNFNDGPKLDSETYGNQEINGADLPNKTDNVYNRLGAQEDTYNHVGQKVINEHASEYGYNYNEEEKLDTVTVTNEYFTLEQGLLAGQYGKANSDNNSKISPNQDYSGVDHEYFTLEPGL